MDDEMLEELYTLLYLYFRIETGSGIVRADKQLNRIEPALDRLDAREDILKEIKKRLQKLHTI